MSLALPKQLRSWFKSRHFGRSSIDTRYALLEACLIGILSGFAALFLKQGVGWLGGWRVQLSQQFNPFWVLPLGGLILGGIGGWLIEWLSPAAAGGGIPQVKAALARFAIPLSLRVAAVKLLGTILVLGAGLTLGRRAPTVHIGAALAAQLSNWLPTSPEHRRQMIAAGAAAGLAAGFTTPIAGVLFVVEELMRDISGLTLETAIVASFTGAVVSLFLESSVDPSARSNLLDGLNTTFSTSDIPYYLILGALAGVLGVLFNRGILLSIGVHRRLNLPLWGRIALTGLISGIVIALLPPFFRDNTGLREFLVTGGLSIPQITVAFTAHFFLTMLAYSSGAPGGLFAPALVLGSALGYLVGNFVALITGVGSEAAYALVGMGAFFTAVVRVPVTAIVIVFELSANFDIVLPLMLSCAVSYIVADSLFKGSLYEHLLKNSGIELTEDSPHYNFLTALTAADVMQSQVDTLDSDLTLDEVITAMSVSSHRGFPVVENGKLVGIFTQTDLNNVDRDSPAIYLKEMMVPNPITVTPTVSLSDVLYLLNRYQLSRLPVVEAQKLVGIITRTDIIRVEANQLGGGDKKAGPAPSYLVYQTRSPTVGRGRILLPLANPATASPLFQMAAVIARQHHYEVECLHVITVAKHNLPAHTRVDTRKGRKLMHRLERMGRTAKILIHCQIRAGNDPANAILETIRERHIDLLVMGWKGNTSTQDAIFGDVVDTLIRKAPCDLMLVKLGDEATAYPYRLQGESNWLVPVAGGPNAQKAMEFLPDLTRLSPQSPKIWLCKVYSPSDASFDYASLEATADSLRQTLASTVISLPIRSASVSDAIIHLAQTESCDLVILGGSQEGLLQQVIHGNIPNAIARQVNSTVILFRGAI